MLDCCKKGARLVSASILGLCVLTAMTMEAARCATARMERASHASVNALICGTNLRLVEPLRKEARRGTKRKSSPTRGNTDAVIPKGSVPTIESIENGTNTGTCRTIGTTTSAAKRSSVRRFQFGLITPRLRPSTERRNFLLVLPGLRTLSTISCRCKAVWFAACTARTIFAWLQGARIQERAIDGGLICLDERIACWLYARRALGCQP